MTPIEEIRKPTEAAGGLCPWPAAVPPTDWPGPWPGNSPAFPAPPAWYYPPPYWYAPPPVEEPPAQSGRVEKLTYTVDQAAEVLNVSRCTVYKLIHRADFPTIKLGKRRLIFREGLAEWARKQAGGGRG